MTETKANSQATKDKFKFGIYTLLSYNSTKEQVDAFEKNFLSCLRQKEYNPDPNVIIYPENWKSQIFESWCEPDVYDLLCSDHVKTIEEFFVLVRKRFDGTSAIVDNAFVEWMEIAVTPNTIDKHSNAVRTFLKKALPENDAMLKQNIDDHFELLSPDETAGKTKNELIGIVGGIRNKIDTLFTKDGIQGPLVNRITSRVLVPMVNQQAGGFTGWKDLGFAGSPKDSPYTDILEYHAKKYQRKPLALKRKAREDNPALTSQVKQLREENSKLQNELANLRNALNQLKNSQKPANQPPKGGDTPKEANPKKRKAQATSYTGPPCAKCPDGSAAAKSHSTERHVDDYKPKQDFKKQKTKPKK